MFFVFITRKQVLEGAQSAEEISQNIGSKCLTGILGFYQFFRPFSSFFFQNFEE